MSARSATHGVLSGIRRTEVVRVNDGRVERVQDAVVVEEPLEIRVGGDVFGVTMRTPGRDFELVAGLLFAEGLIASREDLGTMAHCGRPGEPGASNVIDVTPAPGGRLARYPGLEARSTITSAACGVCGRATIDDLVRRLGHREDSTRLDGAWLARLPEALSEQQVNFARTGGLHAAGAAEHGAALTVVREDVGRHNAVDKVVGRLLLDDRMPGAGSALVVSGRASFEIVQKALSAGFSALVCVSAPSSLAIETAARFGLVLLGFVRGGGFNIYAGAERVT